MPIDKIVPYALNTSNDERLVKATEMTDALNVTVSSDSEGNGFVIKNAKGNVVINPRTGADALPTGELVVIGSIADLDTEFIYLFVWSITPVNSGIYRVSVGQDNNYYQKVFAGVYNLTFEKDSYVDAAITRIDVNQDGTMNTLIYFTDNINEPRKINVERALANEFDDYTDDDYEEFVSVCKTTPKKIISTTLVDNTNIKTNSLYGKSYSFAFQYVYKDGEVSAMSNFSSPMVCKYVLDGANDNGKPIHNEDNEIHIFIPKGNREVSHVNVHFRDNYTNQLYKIGRFSSTESSSKGTLGDQWVYDHNVNTHRLEFRGNSSYTPVSNREALKDFDNVPHKAGAVAIANNRLFYGNYTEHYPATPVNVTLTVSYDAIPSTAPTNLNGYRSWKAGVTHNFGIVFYDKKGRSGPVNDIGSVYVKTVGERVAGSISELGRAKIQVAIPSGQTAPSWAVNYSIVYGGNNDISEFKQYSVADGFASWYKEIDQSSDPASVYHSEGNDNIYLSLKSWSGSKVSYVGSTEADYEYKYKKGDVLDILRYTDSYTGTTPNYVYPAADRAKIIDKLMLLADMSESVVTAQGIQAQIDAINANLSTDIGFFQDILNKITGKETAEELANRLAEERSRARADAIIPQSLRNPIFNGDYAPCKGHFLEVEDIWGIGSIFSPPNPLIHMTPDGETTNINHTIDTPHFHPISGWRRNVIVQVSSPKRYTEKKIYRELNMVQSVSSFDSGASFLLTDGDVFLKNTRVVFAPPIDTDGDAVLDDFNSRNLSSYIFEDHYLESEHASHFFHSKTSDHGHVKVVNEDAATVQRTASITYSDFQANDSNILKYSSFYLADANYKDLPYRYGQIDRIIDEDGYMFVLQDSKVCKLPISKQVLSTGDGQSIVAINKELVGEPVFYGGDYGSSGYPQAVVYREGRIFFFDITSEKIVRTGGDGLTIISDFGLDSFLESNIADIKKAVFEEKPHTIKPRIIGGYDPDYDEYLFTVGPSRHHSLRLGLDETDVGNYVTNNGFTVAFNSKSKTWTSFYSFIPTCYANIGDSLISCFNPSGTNNLFYIHSDEAQYSNTQTGQTPAKGNYYGTKYDSVVEVVSSFNPSMVKVFNALSMETDSSDWTASLFTSDQRTSIDDFKEKERGRYALIPRDESSDVFINIGRVATSGTFNIITFSNRISSTSIPKGAEVYIGLTNSNQTVNKLINRKQLQLSGPVTVSEGNDVYIKLDSIDFGDPMRDYFCKIRLTNTGTDAFELFSISTYYERSMLGQEKGQQ